MSGKDSHQADGASRTAMPSIMPAETPPFAWWRWWLREGPSEPRRIKGVPVAAGDEMMVMLTLLSPTLVRFHIRDSTQGPMTTFDVLAPALPQPGSGALVPVPALGSTAEWIVERPDDANSDEPLKLFKLPDYGRVAFTHCAGRVAKSPGGAPRARELTAPRLIRMVDIFNRPTRRRRISVPRRRKQGEAQLRVEYRSP